MQKPTMGRIVHFKDGQGNTKAAIITFVHNDTLVNLNVFGRDHSEDDFKFTSSSLGDENLQWNWPPKV